MRELTHDELTDLMLLVGVASSGRGTRFASFREQARRLQNIFRNAARVMVEEAEPGAKCPVCEP